MGKIVPNMVFMKKFFALLAALCLLMSCSMDDGGKEFDIEFLPVLSIVPPQYVTPGQTSYFKLYYRRPSDCYFVNGFEYTANGNIRTIAIQSLVVESNDCLSLESTGPESIDMPFVCPLTYDNQSYVFRFYSGNTNVGTATEPQYMEIEVPVVQ
jgi:hypothetical protein